MLGVVVLQHNGCRQLLGVLTEQEPRGHGGGAHGGGAQALQQTHLGGKRTRAHSDLSDGNQTEKDSSEGKLKQNTTLALH